MPDDAAANNPDPETSADSVAEKPHRPAVGAGRSARLIPVAALVVAVLAVALAGWSLLRPTGESVAGGDGSLNAAGEFDDAQRDAAKAKVCSAFQIVSQGVSISTNATAPGGPEDVTGGIAVGANARLAMLGGGQYLLARIDPGTPEKVANGARDFSNLLMDIGATSISGISTSDSAQSARMAEAQTLNVTLAQECGNG